MVALKGPVVSGVRYVQSAGFRGTLRRVQSSGVHYVQSAGFRGALPTECRVQGCSAYRMQGSGVCYIQSTGVATYRVQGSGLLYVESTGFRYAAIVSTSLCRLISMFSTSTSVQFCPICLILLSKSQCMAISLDRICPWGQQTMAS